MTLAIMALYNKKKNFFAQARPIGQKSDIMSDNGVIFAQLCLQLNLIAEDCFLVNLDQRVQVDYFARNSVNRSHRNLVVFH